MTNEEYKQETAQEPDRRVLQAGGTHPAPCARHCEAKAYEIEIRSLNSRLKQAQRPWQGLTPEEMKHLYPYGRSVWGKETYEAIEKALKERNHG